MMMMTAVRHVQKLESCILYDHVTVKDGNGNKNLRSPCRLRNTVLRAGRGKSRKWGMNAPINGLSQSMKEN